MHIHKKGFTIVAILQTHFMKRILPLLVACCATAATVSAQNITITSADMPVSGDTLRWSATGIDSSRTSVARYLPTDTANYNWDFSWLRPARQGVDTYKRAMTVSPLYAIISPTAYGYKVADSFSLPIPGVPLSIKNAYTFFNIKNNPSRFVAEGYGAQIAGIPTPAAYSNEDEIYYLPLVAGKRDSSTYKFEFSIPGLGKLVRQGTRITEVDGSGNITTPFISNAACLRVKSEVYGTDSLVAQGISLPIPHNTIEYKWLAKTHHYPLLWVTTNKVGTTQVVQNVTYRDMYRPNLGVASPAVALQRVDVYVDAAARSLRLFLPAGWQRNTVEVFDVNGRVVLKATDATEVDSSTLAGGTYLLRITSPQGVGYAKAVL